MLKIFNLEIQDRNTEIYKRKLVSYETTDFYRLTCLKHFSI